MYLSRLCIENFRSIRNLDLQFSPGKNVIIGRNNAGKSNIIKAIDLVLGETSPDYYKVENISDEDFFTDNGQKSNEITIWCQLTRPSDETLDYETLYQSVNGFHRYGKYGSAPFRVQKENVPSNIMLFHDETQFENKKQWIDIRNHDSKILEKQLDSMFQFGFGFTACHDINGRIEKSLRLYYREDDQSDWVLCLKAPFRTELLQSAFIPSFRDPQNQLRLNQWSWYGKLIRHLTAGYENDSKMQKAISEISAVAEGIFNDVTEKVSDSSIATIFPETKLHFQFNTENRNDLFKSCVLYVDDGYKTQLTSKGSGIQSAVTIGLFSYYTREINTKGSALLCIEEPELYLHPHARRVISNNLSAFVGDNRNQVIVSTHSSEFVNFPENIQLILVRKNGNRTEASPLMLKDLQTFMLDNNQNEFLFAEKIILCEGYENYVIKLLADEYFPGELDNKNISIVSVQGKDRFKDLLRYFLKIGIKCYIMADFDFLLRDKSEDRRVYGKDVKAHDCVADLGLPYFSQDYLFSEAGSVILSKIARLRNKIKEHHPNLFYISSSLEDFKDKPEFDWIVGVLSELRQSGICLLDGQIEDLILPQFHIHGKLDRQAMWIIKTWVDDGIPPSLIFNSDIIVDFLSFVLNSPYLIKDEDLPF